ncbi:hypothetical protein ABTG29_10860 [Acinetobacter baumannii]
MDDRNLELEEWLIETAGEEMMANHLGPNWNKFNEEFGFYPNMAMTVADLVWQHQQAKVEELQRRNQMLNDNIKEQGQKLVYQNEVIETQAEKLLGLRDEKAELQKRVDAAKQLIEDLNKCYQQDHQNKFEYWRGFADSAGILGKRLEQALKGEGQ